MASTSLALASVAALPSTDTRRNSLSVIASRFRKRSVTVDPTRRPFQSFNVAGGDHGSRTPGDRFGAGRYERDGRIEFAFEAMARADLPTETLRLNGHLPLAGNAGKSAWYVFQAKDARAGLFPADLGGEVPSCAKGGDLGWVLVSGAGVRIVPDWRTLGFAFVQDARQWGGATFQLCLAITESTTLRAGQTYRAFVAIELLTAQAVAERALATGQPLLSIEIDGEGDDDGLAAGGLPPPATSNPTVSPGAASHRTPGLRRSSRRGAMIGHADVPGPRCCGPLARGSTDGRSGRASDHFGRPRRRFRLPPSAETCYALLGQGWTLRRAPR